jgi:saccharopine dehydrogenase (NAD+, L-lysine forming)
MKIGLIREGKNPPDNRIALTPQQCAFVERLFPVKIIVEPSPTRCFSDVEIDEEDVKLSSNLQSCDFLLGIKEVPIEQLIENKTYFFFSHTIKKQSHNRPLLKAILEKKITLIDYEVLTDEYGQRLIAFGKFAGMVGAHNGILGYGLKTGTFILPRMRDCISYAEAREIYNTIDFPPLKIVVTGSGRVAKGAIEVLHDMSFKQVSPEDFVQKKYDHAVYTQISAEHYVERKDGKSFEKWEYYKDPSVFKSVFTKFSSKADIFINCIFYDKNAPKFFELSDMAKPDFNIKSIADVSCDLMPFSSVPSTIKATTIADPFYGFDPLTNQETSDPFDSKSVLMMTIDNLPNEIPRDASEYFGEQFIINILPELQAQARGEKSRILERATITHDGKLTERFSYLGDWVSGKE